MELQQLLIILPKSQKARFTTRQTSCLPVCFPTHWANSLSKFTPPKPPLQTSILCIHFTKAPGPCSVMGAWIQLPETHTCQHCLREHCLCVCYQHIVVPVLISPFLWPVSPLWNFDFPVTFTLQEGRPSYKNIYLRCIFPQCWSNQFQLFLAVSDFLGNWYVQQCVITFSYTVVKSKKVICFHPCCQRIELLTLNKLLL